MGDIERMQMQTRFEDIEKHGLSARGRKEILAHLEGKKLTLKQAVLGKCYDCMGYYSDGKVDCEMKNCTLYPFMSYNPNRAKSSRVMSDKQKEAVQKMHQKAVISRSDSNSATNSEQTAKRHRKVA
jgi:hypothetical protein